MASMMTDTSLDPDELITEFLAVSRHDIAGIWVAFFSRRQRYRCGQEELVTCNDQPPVGDDATRQPRATYHVYAAYGNTSGLMVPVGRHCDFADAFASYVGQPLRPAV